MVETREAEKCTKEDYRAIINQMGKKEFTLLKMQEYGFWPKDLRARNICNPSPNIYFILFSEFDKKVSIEANSYGSTFSHNPVPGLRKSGILLSVLIPAPVRATIFFDFIIS